MNKHINRLKFLSVLLTVATAGGTSALAMDRNTIGSARSTAIHDCNIEANKFSSITPTVEPICSVRNLHDHSPPAVWLSTDRTTRDRGQVSKVPVRSTWMSASGP